MNLLAAMKMMEHETDKLKEMQLSDAMEKESLRDALQTMKDRMERLEKEKGMAEEARHMARPLEEQLVGLLKVFIPLITSGQECIVKMLSLSIATAKTSVILITSND